VPLAIGSAGVAGLRGPCARRARPVRGLLRGRSAIALTLFAVANVAGFLLVYGLNIWLPQLMRQSGYPLGSAISFLLVFKPRGRGRRAVGLRVGRPVRRPVGGHHGIRIGVVSIGLLAVPFPTPVLYAAHRRGRCRVGRHPDVVFGYVALHFAARTGPRIGISTGVGRLGAARDRSSAAS